MSGNPHHASSAHRLELVARHEAAADRLIDDRPERWRELLRRRLTRMRRERRTAERLRASEPGGREAT